MHADMDNDIHIHIHIHIYTYGVCIHIYRYIMHVGASSKMEASAVTSPAPACCYLRIMLATVRQYGQKHPRFHSVLRHRFETSFGLQFLINLLSRCFEVSSTYIVKRVPVGHMVFISVGIVLKLLEDRSLSRGPGRLPMVPHAWK